MTGALPYSSATRSERVLEKREPGRVGSRACTRGTTQVTHPSAGCCYRAAAPVLISKPLQRPNLKGELSSSCWLAVSECRDGRELRTSSRLSAESTGLNIPVPSLCVGPCGGRVACMLPY